MADDMVASLTLRLQNQMSSGVDAIKGQFNALGDTLTQLNATMGELRDMMATMRGPVQLQADLQAVQGEATKAAAAITGSVTQVSAAIDADVAKIRETYAALGDASAFVPPQYASPAFIPPGSKRDDRPAFRTTRNDLPAFRTTRNDLPLGYEDDDEDDDRAPSGRKLNDKHTSIPGEGWLMDLIALGAGYSGEESYAKFQEIALQAAVIEGFHGKAALLQAKNIMHESYNQAYLSRGNVDDIEQAYFNLIKQGLPHSLVDQMMGPLTEAATTYSTPVADIAQPLFNLAEQFKIPGDQLAQGLAVLGAASHLGHFYFSDFSQGLPKIASEFQLEGITGLRGEVTAASALEVVRRAEPDSSSTYTDLYDLMNYMSSPLAVRFFDRTQRSKDLLGKPLMDLLDKFHIAPLDLPKFMDDERAHGIDPLNAITNYMHSIWRPGMSPTDLKFVYGALFHNSGAAQAMLGLVENYGLFTQDQNKLSQISPNFLDNNFQTMIQGDLSGLDNISLLLTYLNRLYGQNTFGLFVHNSKAPSQADANALFPGSSAFNIPIAITVNVDKSGNVTGTATAGKPGAPVPGVSVRVNNGRVLGRH